MAVLFGSLLTIANVGDSKAFIDTSSELEELTTSHRIEDNVGVYGLPDTHDGLLSLQQLGALLSHCLGT